MKPLTHTYERFGCKIDADLENTVAVLTDPDGKQANFNADPPEDPEPQNALWHALQAAKADQRARGELAAEEARRKIDAKEIDEPTEISVTDVEHVEGADEL